MASNVPLPAQEAAEGTVTGPVAIRNYEPVSPKAMAGTEIDPEVEVRVAIDATGVVTDVEVLAIEPSSEFDDLLRIHVEHALAQWRYAPARDAEDNPTDSSLSWRLKFKSRAVGEEDIVSQDLGPRLQVLIEAGGLTAPAEPLTSRQRAQSLSRAVEAAERYIDRDHRRRRETQRFILITDAAEESTIDVLAGNMESIYEIFHSLFDPHIEPLPENFKTVVYLFRRQASLLSLQTELGSTGFGAGFYRSPGLMAFHQQVQTSEQLLHSMFHEAFHAFSDSHLTPPGKQLPQWVEEGLAEYFANSKIERGHLIPGKISGSKYILFHRRSRQLRGTASWSLKEARTALRNGEAPSVAELLEASRDTFYGLRYQSYYGFSWLLTHFLRHGREEWDTARLFGTMLLYLVQGYSGRDAIEAAFGMDPEELQPEFEQYVRRI
ncbi:MAG: hypothetical protein OXG74_04710 [Acidobacteria bacterium]|nr:hypothetical protein [Acidobacteriota bacterium]